MYMFCIEASMIPDKLKLGNLIHPGPPNFTEEENELIETFFLKNKEEIIKKVREKI